MPVPKKNNTYKDINGEMAKAFLALENLAQDYKPNSVLPIRVSSSGGRHPCNPC